MENKSEILQKENFEKLVELGIQPWEAVKIRKVFIDYGIENRNVFLVSKDGKYFKNKNVPNMAFNTEKEAVFAEHLFNLNPDMSQDEKMTAFSVVLKLMGVETESTFNRKK